MTKARSLSDFIESDGSVTLVDNQKIKVGTGNDLEIYHDGNSKISDGNSSSDLLIQSNNIVLEKNDGENMIHCAGDGAVQLYHNGSSKLATTSSGVSVTGDVGATTATIAGNISQTDGDYLYSGGGNFDIKHTTASQNIVFSTTPSGGSATERFRITHDGNLSALNDTSKLLLGSAGDLQLYHDGSNSYLKDAGTGDLYIQGEANVRITDGDGNKMFLGQNDGEVQLYHNGLEKLNTTSTGVTVTGKVVADELDINGMGDFQVSHSSTDVTAANSNTTLRIGNSAAGNGIYNAIKFAANQQDMYMMSFNNSAQANRRLGFFVGSVAGDAVSDERLSITGSGYVGINETSPDRPLHIVGPDGTTGLVEGNSRTALFLDNAGATYLNMAAANSSDAAIFFSDAAANNRGALRYQHSNDTFDIDTAGTTALSITSIGHMYGKLLASGNTNPLGSGTNSGKLWSTSGTFTNVWYVGNDPTGVRYWIELDLQGLDGYTSYGTLYKDRNGRWRIVKHRQAGTDFTVSSDNNYIQVNQNSGATQTNSSGNLRLVRLMGSA